MRPHIVLSFCLVLFMFCTAHAQTAERSEFSKAAERAVKSADIPAKAGDTAGAEADEAVKAQITQASNECSSLFDQTESACSPSQVDGDGVKAGGGIGGAAAGAENALDQVEKASSSKYSACKSAIDSCTKTCKTKLVELQQACTNCSNSDFYSLSRAVHGCYAQRSMLHEYGRIAKRAKKGKEEARDIGKGSGDIDSSTGKPAPVEPVPSSGGTYAGGGADPTLPNMGGLSGARPESVPNQKPDPTSGKESFTSADGKDTSKEGFKKDKAQRLRDLAGMAGAQTLNPALMEQSSPMPGSRMGLFPSVDGTSRSPASVNSKEQESEKLRAQEAALGRAGFTTPGARRYSNGSAAAANAVPEQMTASGFRPASANGSTLGAATQGAGQWENSASQAKLDPAKPYDGRPHTDATELNQRPFGTDEGGGGGSRRVRNTPAPMNLAEYLPTGSKYRGQRGPAGMDSEKQGIQGKAVDIWGQITNRFRTHCLDGRLRDCRISAGEPR